jgi:hypothetical protein
MSVSSKALEQPLQAAMQGFDRTESFSRFHQDNRHRARIEPIRTDDGCAWVAVDVGVEFLRLRTIVVPVAN